MKDIRKSTKIYIVLVLIIAMGVGLAILVYNEVAKPNVSDIIEKYNEDIVKSFSNNELIEYSLQYALSECINTQVNELTQEIGKHNINIDMQNIDNYIWTEKVTSYLNIEGYTTNEYKYMYVTDNNKGKLEVSLNTVLNEDKLRQELVSTLDENKVSMIGASGKLVNGNMKITSEGRTGKNYTNEQLEELITYIKQSLEQSIYTDINTVFTYKDIEISPKVSDLQQINTKISSFSTRFTPNGNRGTNIKVATERLNEVTIGNEEILSVDKAILYRNAKNGYEKAGSYLNGKTVQTYGGGVCQVSTTLYGAIIRAGIVPVERNAHSMSVGYVPIGLDAAIAEGYKDLKIQNTYDKPIYIEGIASGGTLTFNIWGEENILNGFTYKPVSSSSNNGLKATAKLQKIHNGNVVEEIGLYSSAYRPHS